MKLTHLDYAVDGNVIYPLLLIEQDMVMHFIGESETGRIVMKFVPRRRKKRGA